jgi:preprotein translocase subunit SecE
MIEWFNDTVVWAFKNSKLTYAFIVVITMVSLGSIIGLGADVLIRLFGLNLDKYTDSHT